MPHSLFCELGLHYLGPVDGHDITALEAALERAKAHGAPVVVHCITRKGLAYAPAEQNEEDHLHGIDIIDPQTGHPLRPAGLTWTAVFGRELVELADAHPDVVAITAAMPGSVGLNDFAARYPARFFDVGIAEQHAVASAAGMAMAGLHPVIALYGTSLNRALDQMLMDLALHRLGATLVLDRSGVTGDDGPGHNGLWDLAMLQAVPGLRIGAPRDARTLRRQLRQAVSITDAPTVLRYPRGTVGPAIPAIPAVGRAGAVDVLREAPGGGVLFPAARTPRGRLRRGGQSERARTRVRDGHRYRLHGPVRQRRRHRLRRTAVGGPGRLCRTGARLRLAAAAQARAVRRGSPRAACLRVPHPRDLLERADCSPAGHTAVAGAFLAFGTLGWVVLDYGIPLALITTLKRGPSLDQVNGTWFLWSVGSESVAVAAASPARVPPGHRTGRPGSGVLGRRPDAVPADRRAGPGPAAGPAGAAGRPHAVRMDLHGGRRRSPCSPEYG
jgi:hypothetical protein